MDRIAVLIPCFNEAGTIHKVISDFRAALPEAVIYIYDNNSTDGTAEIAFSAGAVVRREYAQGKGNVIRRMFREIDAECYLMVDGDDTYPAEAAPKLVEGVLERGADMVVGDRLSSTYFTENRRRFHNGGNSFVRMAVNRLFHTDYQDLMTGFRAFSFEFAKTFPVLSEGFEIETEMAIHAADKRLRVENVVIDYRNRPEGSFSKLNTIPDGLRVLAMIVRMCQTYQPMLYFGTISILLVLLSLGFVTPVLEEYVRTGLVRRFPTLIVCCFVFLTAIVSFFAGLILKTLGLKDRQEFEYQLLRAEDRKKALLSSGKGTITNDL